MQLNIKDNLKLIAIMVLYIVLGSLHVYTGTIIILFPILVLPMIIWMLSNKQDLKRDIVIQLGIAIGVFLVTQSIEEVVLYIMNVSIPAMIVTMTYRKSVDIPHIIVYTTLGVVLSLYIFVIVQSYVGVNYLESYFDILDKYKSMQLEVFDVFVKQTPKTLSAEQIDLFKELIYNQITLLKYIYPALAIILSIGLTTIMLVLLTLIGKIKRWHMTSLRQLVHFKLSKEAAVLLILGLLLIEVDGKYGNVLSMLGMNLFFLMQVVFQWVGIITIITFIRRGKMSTFVKALSILLSIMMFYASPILIMMLGLFDTLFDYRKAEITV